MNMKCNTLAVAILAAVIVTTGCGGGGSNTRPDAPPPATTPPNNPPNTTRYTGPADNHIVPTNADRANAASFTGVPAPFAARGQDLRQDRGLVGVTFGHEFADAEAEVASGGLVGHRAGLGVRSSF